MSDLLTTKELLAEIRVSRSTLRRLRIRGEFVEPIRLGERKLHWRRDDVAGWMSTR